MNCSTRPGAARRGQLHRRRPRVRRARSPPAGRRPWWRPAWSARRGAGTSCDRKVQPITCSVARARRRCRLRLPERATRWPSTRAWPSDRGPVGGEDRGRGGSRGPATEQQPRRERRRAATSSERARAARSAGARARVSRRRARRGPVPGQGRGAGRAVPSTGRRRAATTGRGAGGTSSRAALLAAAEPGDDRRQPAPAGQPQRQRLADADAREPLVVDAGLPGGEQAAPQVPGPVAWVSRKPQLATR